MGKYRYVGDVEVWVPDVGRVLQPDEVVDLPEDREVSEELWQAVGGPKKTKGDD